MTKTDPWPAIVAMLEQAGAPLPPPPPPPPRPKAPASRRVRGRLVPEARAEAASAFEAYLRRIGR